MGGNKLALGKGDIRLGSNTDDEMLGNLGVAEAEPACAISNEYGHEYLHSSGPSSLRFDLAWSRSLTTGHSRTMCSSALPHALQTYPAGGFLGPRSRADPRSGHSRMKWSG
jgi:hypothetical protein